MKTYKKELQEALDLLSHFGAELTPSGKEKVRNLKSSLEEPEEEIDLLANYHLLPLDVQNILHSYDENKDSYKECERISEALKPHGYTVDYDLSGTLFDLKKKV